MHRLIGVFLIATCGFGLLVLGQESVRDKKRERGSHPFYQDLLEWVALKHYKLPDMKFWIWTERDVYKVGEKIVLFTELVAKERFSGCASDPITFAKVADNYTLRLYRDGYVVEPKRWPKVWSRDEYMVKPGEVPYWRLHGQRQVFAKDKTFPLGPTVPDYLQMEPGDSHVEKIPDLMSLFVTKVEEGRVYVKCFKPDPKRFKKFVWLPIEGRYKVQYYNSNVIEFEIRQ